MTAIEWNHVNERQWIRVLGMTVVVTEKEEGHYVVHVEDAEGNILRQDAAGIPGVEEAKQAAVFTAVDLQQMAGGDSAQASLIETLDRCISLVSPTVHPAHLARLEYLREWVRTKADHEREMAVKQERGKIAELEWNEVSSGHFVASTPFGLAVIVEERPRQSRHKINPSSTIRGRIEDPSGAIYESLERFDDLSRAQEWVTKCISDLNDPRLAEIYLENIHFTLDVCRRSLPSKELSDLDQVRLDYLQMLLDDRLL